MASLAIILCAITGVNAQTYTLAETPKAGDCYRYQLDMSLIGEMRVTREDTVVPLKMAAWATHTFPERLLSIQSDGLPLKAGRIYETAKAEITVGGNRSARALRPERQLLVAQRGKDVTLVYSPVGPLTREELQLTSEHLNTLVLTGLLPGKAVGIGEPWQVAHPVIQALCLFEGLTGQDVICKLESVRDQIASVSVSGPASGIDLGALAKVAIQATYRFDLKQGRLIELEWRQKDEREQGPVSPAMTLEMKTILKRTAIEQPSALSDIALVKIPEGVEAAPALMTHLYYRDPKSRFEMHYGRDWQIVGQTEQHLVLRLMDRGDFVAQATITPWTPAKPGEHLSPEEFRRAMASIPGWEPNEELQAGEVPLDGCWGYRFSALGQLDGLRVTQNFYLLASPKGEQLVVTFTMNPSQAEQLGTRDLSLVGSIDFPSSRKDR